MCDDAFELLETERYPTFIPYEKEKEKETGARRRMRFIPDACKVETVPSPSDLKHICVIKE